MTDSVTALATVVQGLARDAGLDLGEVRRGPGDEALVGATRGEVVISARGGDWYGITISRYGVPLADGQTGVLGDAARAAQAWRAGATLAELHARFPFMTYTPLGQAYEDGDPAGYRWRTLLADEELTRIRPLLEAAYADPRLRELVPSVSHLTLLRLDTDYRNRESVRILVELGSDGAYRIRSTARDESTVEDSVSRAVAVAAALLP